MKEIPGAPFKQTVDTNKTGNSTQELHEWETAEYIRDARRLGSNTALIMLGHGVSEEPGMEWLVQWLHPKISGLPITPIASGDPFTWI